MRFECPKELLEGAMNCTDAIHGAEVIENWLAARRHLPTTFRSLDDAGRPITPSTEYVLDAIIQRLGLYDEASARGMFGGLGVVALPHERYTCDLCRGDKARYDAATVPTGLWAWMCASCYRINSRGVLGLGIGQFLIDTVDDSGGCIELYRHLSRLIEGA